MADISPGQFPTTPSFQAVAFKIVTPTITSVTNSGKMRRVGQGHSYYSFDVKYPQISAQDQGKVMAFVATAQGPVFSFEIVLPEISTSKATDATTANTTITTSANITYGQRYVTVNNCGNNKQIVKAGDYFRFANHSKVYMATQDVTSNGAGAANITFSGSSVTSVTSGTRLQIQDVPFTVVLAEEEQSYDVGYGGVSTLSLSMREVW
jgi:hypothetical protein